MSRYAYHDLDPLLHAPARLSIVTALYAHEDGMPFVDLRELCELSDGNLSRHLQKLEEGEVVCVTKEFVGRTPRTTATLTPDGRARFERYVEHLRSIVEHDIPAPSQASTRSTHDTLGFATSE